MEKAKHSRVVSNVYQEDGKYYCAECARELPIRQPCPICKKEIDWDKVFIELRR